MRILQPILTLCFLLLALTACQAGNPLALPTETPPPATATLAPTASPTPLPGTVAGFNDFLNQIKSASNDTHIIIMGDLKSGNISDKTKIEKTVTRVIHKPFKPEEIDSIIGELA